MNSLRDDIVMQGKGDSVYLLHVIRARFEYPELRSKVIDVHRQWQNACSKYALFIEDKGSGMSLIQDLKREFHIHAIAIDPVGTSRCG